MSDCNHDDAGTASNRAVIENRIREYGPSPAWPDDPVGAYRCSRCHAKLRLSDEALAVLIDAHDAEQARRRAIVAG